jgi:hypothetical protein
VLRGNAYAHSPQSKAAGDAALLNAMANAGALAILSPFRKLKPSLMVVSIVQLLKVKLLPARSVCNFRIPFGAFKLLAYGSKGLSNFDPSAPSFLFL